MRRKVAKCVKLPMACFVADKLQLLSSRPERDQTAVSRSPHRVNFSSILLRITELRLHFGNAERRLWRAVAPVSSAEESYLTMAVCVLLM